MLVSLWWPARRHAYYAAAAATALTVLGYFLSAPGGIAWVAIVNRGVALFFIWVTALLIAQRKKVERSLPQARQQFEARVAERTAETERHPAQETLRQSEERLWAVFEDAPVGIAITDSVTGRFVRINDRYAEICGYSQRELLGTTFQATTHPDDLEADLANMRRLLDGTLPSFEIEKRHIHKDGSIVWVTMTCVPLWKTPDDPRLHLAVVVDVTERKRAEQAVRESEERLRQIAEIADEAFFLSDAKDDTFIYVSPAYEAIWGRSVATLFADHRGWQKAIHPDDQGRTSAVLDRHARGREAFQQEYRIVRPDGEIRWVRDRVFPVRNESGEVYRIAAISQDITERKRAEGALKEMNVALANAMPGIARLDIDGRYVEVNDIYAGMMGFRPDEMIGSDWRATVHPEDRAGAIHAHERMLLEGKGEFEARGVRKDATTFFKHVLLVKITDEQGASTGHHCFMRDSSERRLAEEAQRESDLWMGSIFSSLEEAVCVVTADRCLVNVNAAAERTFGYSKDELANHSTEILHVDHEHYLEFGKRIQEAFERSETACLEFELKRKNGEVFPTEHTVSLLKNDAGKAIGIVSVVRDITQRKQAEKKREELIVELEARNAEMERFAYTVSHDLKAPLITIRGFLGLLEKDTVAGELERAKRDLEQIDAAAAKMQRLLGELLELSRIGRVVDTPQDVSVAGLAYEVVELLAGRIAERGAIVEIAPDLPEVRGDRARLFEVLQNLICNAIKFMGAQPDPHVEIGARRDGEETVLFVRDNGMGIDPRHHKKIFGLFNRLDSESDGTGIGLALAKRIVEVHGGRMWVESEGRGRGCTFCFSIPHQGALVTHE